MIDSIFPIQNRIAAPHHQETCNNCSVALETDFTLTQICQTGIINSWHYSKLVGADHDNI
jgi:hypothetical protein